MRQFEFICIYHLSEVGSWFFKVSLYKYKRWKMFNGENVKRMSIEQYNIELDKAMEEVKREETYTHDEVIKMVQTINDKKNILTPDESETFVVNFVSTSC